MNHDQYMDLLNSLSGTLRAMGGSKRPTFKDTGPGETVITLEDGAELRLSCQPNKISLGGHNGFRLETFYESEQVSTSWMNAADRVLHFEWHFLDPHAYEISLTFEGATLRSPCDHNTLLPTVLHFLQQVRRPLPQAPEYFVRFCKWKTWSSDFEREYGRRTIAYYPAEYIKAICRADCVNMRWNSWCFAAMVMLATGPTPDDLFWLGIAASQCPQMLA